MLGSSTRHSSSLTATRPWRRVLPLCSPRRCLSLCALVLGLALLMVCLAPPLLLPDYRLHPATELSLALTSLHRLHRHCSLHSNDTDPPIHVTLSTLPARLPHLYRTLKSLLSQTLCPASVHIWIPRHNTRLHASYAIPAWLSDMAAEGGTIHVHTVDVDYGPMTKLLPALAELTLPPDSRLLVVDDDVLYSPRLLQQYVCYTRLLPSAVLSMQGRGYYDGWFQLNRFKAGEFAEPHPVDLVYGTASFLVQPRMFDGLQVEAIGNGSLAVEVMRGMGEGGWGWSEALRGLTGEARAERVQKAARYEDDWWWSLLLLHQRVPRVAVPIDQPQLDQLDTLFVVTRGSLTSTINSREGDPAGGGRSNALIMAALYVQLARQLHLPATIVPKGFNASRLMQLCPMTPMRDVKSWRR